MSMPSEDNSFMAEAMLALSKAPELWGHVVTKDQMLDLGRKLANISSRYLEQVSKVSGKSISEFRCCIPYVTGIMKISEWGGGIEL